MREAIERSAANNALRQKRLDARRSGFKDPGARFLTDLFGGQRAIDKETARLEPQLAELETQRSNTMAQAIQNATPEQQAAFATLPRAKQEEIFATRFNQKPAQRQIVRNAAGFNVFADTDERVSPNAQLKKTSPLVNIEGDRENAREKEREKRRSGIIGSVFDKAESARGTLDQSQIIEDNLNALVQQGNVTSPAFGLLNTINNLGAAAGLDINLDASASTTAIEAASNALAIPMTKQLGVNPTDKDFAIIKSTVARAGTSMPANFAFVDLTKQAANRDIAEEVLILSLDEGDKSESEIRKARSKFRRNNPLQPAIPAPRNPEDFVVGKRYTTPNGIWQFDGTKMVRVR